MSIEDHINKWDKVLSKLNEKSFKVNAETSFFVRNELEYLGFRITRQQIMSLPDKVEAIKNIAVTFTKKQLRSFIGRITYYRAMWQHISEILAILSRITLKQTKWNWSKEYRRYLIQLKS